MSGQIEWRGVIEVGGPTIFGVRDGIEESAVVMFDMTAQDILDAADSVESRLDDLDDAPREIQSELEYAENVCSAVTRLAAKMRHELRCLEKTTRRMNAIRCRPEIETARAESLALVHEMRCKIVRALNALGELGESEDEEDDR